MQTTGSRIHVGGQGVDVRALEFRNLAVLHEQRGKRVAVIGELLQYARVCRRAGRGFLEDWEVQVVEENLAEFWIRVDVELLAGLGIDLLLHTSAFALETLLECSKPFYVDRDAAPLHFREDGNQRHL